MLKFRRAVPLAVGAGVVLAVAVASAGANTAASPHVCSGSFSSPGVLKGAYPNGVVVKGVCFVNDGQGACDRDADRERRLGVGGAFWRSPFQPDASPAISFSIVVAPRLLGCKANPNGTGMACVDDPNQSHPTLTSRERVSGNMIAHKRARADRA